MEKIKTDKIPLWVIKTLIIAGIYGFSAFLYIAINDYNAGKTGAILSCRIDELIAFNRHWVWPYYFYYCIIAFPIFIIKDKQELKKGMFVYLISMLVTSAFYFFWRTQMIRPEIINNDLSSRLLQGIYNRDNPYNCFPSQHVTYSFTAAFMTLRHNKTLGCIGLFVAFTIALSTMFVKQHWFADFPSGVAVAALAYAIVYKTGLFKDNPIK
ncbi:phosphatase PAP2 family protein [bacterium]|nr:phosphatase PAP2 family protein [bacterium]